MAVTLATSDEKPRLRTTPPPAGRFFSWGQVVFAALLGGPLAGSILLWMNYRRLRKDEQGLAVLSVGAIASIGLLFFTFVLGEGLAVIILYAIPIFAVMLVYSYGQKDDFERHIADGGKRGVAAAVVGIAMCCLTPMLVVKALPLCRGGEAETEQVRSFEGGEVRYSEDISSREVDDLGEYLVESKHFFEGSSGRVHVRKKDRKYQLYIPMTRLTSEDAFDRGLFTNMGQEASYRVFRCEEVEVVLCDELLNPHRVIGTSDYDQDSYSFAPSDEMVELMSDVPGSTNLLSKGLYVVLPDDSLTGIVRQYMVDIEELRDLNGMSESQGVYPGMRLKIPGRYKE